MTDDGATTHPDANRLPLLGPALIILMILAALVLYPRTPALPILAAVVATSLVICALSLVGNGSTLRATLVCWVVALGLYGVTRLVRGETDAIAPAAGVLVAVGAFVSYALHRYERVSLGLVSEKS